jgi:hypothetical protein
LGWFVDPGRVEDGAGFGGFVDEPGGVAGVGGAEYISSGGADGLGSSVVDVGRM